LAYKVMMAERFNPATAAIAGGGSSKKLAVDKADDKEQTMVTKAHPTIALLCGATILAAGCAAPPAQTTLPGSQRAATEAELMLIRDGVSYRVPDPANAAIRNVYVAANPSAHEPEGTPVCGEVNNGYLGFVPFRAVLRKDGGLTVVEVAQGADRMSVLEACRLRGIALPM